MEDVHIGDEVIVIGQQNGNVITWHEMAQLAGTIPYELLCNLSSKCERIYV